MLQLLQIPHDTKKNPCGTPKTWLSQINCRSVVQSHWTLCNPMDCSTPDFPVLYFPEFAQTHVHWVGGAIQPSHPLCLQLYLLPSVFPSIRVFSNKPALSIRWPKDWSFNFSISPCNAYSVLISLRINWLDVPVVLETLKSLLQHHSSKASVLQCSAFFLVQLSDPEFLLKKPKLWLDGPLLAKSSLYFLIRCLGLSVI